MVNIFKLLARAGDEAKIGFKVHIHMLRHACGYALANKGIDTRTLQAYLGHRSINSQRAMRHWPRGRSSQSRCDVKRRCTKRDRIQWLTMNGNSLDEVTGGNEWPGLPY